jgi:hypothetical protein
MQERRNRTVLKAKLMQDGKALKQELTCNAPWQKFLSSLQNAVMEAMNMFGEHQGVSD